MHCFQYPDGESISPYVFICENPQELVVKFPIKGKHKICKFDSELKIGGTFVGTFLPASIRFPSSFQQKGKCSYPGNANKITSLM